VKRPALSRLPAVVPRGRAAVAGVIAGVLTLVGSLVHIGVGWATALPDDAVLRLDDTVVSEARFHDRIDVLSALYGVRQPRGGPAADRFRRDAAKSLAVSMILEREAVEHGVVVGDRTARDALDKIIESQLGGDRSAFVRFLAAKGIAEQDVLDEVERQLATTRLLERITADVPEATDEDARAAFQERRDQLVVPERRHLRNIVVDTRAKAASLLSAVNRGADFARLAAAYSLDGSTKHRGGDLGTLAAAELDGTFADAAFAAPPGSAFGPVRTKHGWNVGYVESMEAERSLSFRQVADRLKQELTTRRTLRTWRSWLSEQIRAADVEYAPEYQPADPDAPPVTPGVRAPK